MSPEHREAKIMAVVACPVCAARIGQPCHMPQRGRVIVHPERKGAWQQWRDAQPPDYVMTPRAEGPVGQRTGQYIVVAPQSTAALGHLRSIASDATLIPRWEWIGGAVRVPVSYMPTLTRRLSERGWRIAESL